MTNNFISLSKFWKGKKVFLTGHTGFKGSWFTILLNLLGAKVVGYSLKPGTKPNLFDLVKLNRKIYKSIIGDIRDYEKLKKSISNFSPDFIVHMAAQPLVRHSYKNPKYTYEVNTIGTVNILNILNELSFVKSALIITTDKVYDNDNNKNYFKENNRLGGFDPYSNSKACAELAVNSYNRSFLEEKNILVATARAGNVVGGGDFSKDRILPDYFRSLSENKCLILRSPKSIRPWQHVIDLIYGYLLLLMKLHKKQKNINSSWNFGPHKSSNKPVKDVISIINKKFDCAVRVINKNKSTKKYYESEVLMLNSYKSKKILNWTPKYNLEKSLQLTCDWHKAFLSKKNILKFSQNQIQSYFN